MEIGTTTNNNGRYYLTFDDYKDVQRARDMLFSIVVGTEPKEPVIDTNIKDRAEAESQPCYMTAKEKENYAYIGLLVERINLLQKENKELKDKVNASTDK